MSDGPARSVRSARESFRWLMRRWGQLDPEGIKIPRDPMRYPDQLTVDDVLERLQVLQVPAPSVEVAILTWRSGRVSYEVRVDMEGVRYLATIYPELQQALSELADLVDPGPDGDPASGTRPPP